MRSSAIVYVAVLVSAVYGLPRRFLYDDPCTQDPEDGHPHINHPNIGVTDYDVNMTCKNGSFYWNYPTGTIILHFRWKTSFSVCFQDRWSADYLQFSDVTDGIDKPFPTFDRDHPHQAYCVKSMNKHVDIKMYAPMQTYMASISYLLK